MADEFCEVCGSELIDENEILDGVCFLCGDEDAAELGFLDELVDFGGEG